MKRCFVVIILFCFSFFSFAQKNEKKFKGKFVTTSVFEGELTYVFENSRKNKKSFVSLSGGIPNTDNFFDDIFSIKEIYKDTIFEITYTKAYEERAESGGRVKFNKLIKVEIYNK